MAPAPSAADLLLSLPALPTGPEAAKCLSQDTSSSSELTPDWRVPGPEPRARGVLARGRLGCLPGTGRVTGAAQSPATDGRVHSRALPARCPGLGVGAPSGTWPGGWGRTVLRSGWRCPLCSRLSTATGDEGRPAPPLARPRPANPRRRAGGGAGLGRGGGPGPPGAKGQPER